MVRVAIDEGELPWLMAATSVQIHKEGFGFCEIFEVDVRKEVDVRRWWHVRIFARAVTSPVEKVSMCL